MSQGTACRNRDHRPAWRVLVRRANYSAFNGGRRTPSDYSDVWCTVCDVSWRTRAAYVDSLLDGRPCGRCRGLAVTTLCRICRSPFCASCFTDHHHEGYGVPAEDR